jgi:hypothetical protein
MRTVYHLIQNRMTLEVICVNCANSGVLNHRYLARRFGMGMVLSQLRFRCRRCQARQYRLRFVPDNLGEPAPLKMQWFRGAYEKFQE